MVGCASQATLTHPTGVGPETTPRRAQEPDAAGGSTPGGRGSRVASGGSERDQLNPRSTVSRQIRSQAGGRSGTTRRRRRRHRTTRSRCRCRCRCRSGTTRRRHGTTRSRSRSGTTRRRRRQGTARSRRSRHVRCRSTGRSTHGTRSGYRRRFRQRTVVNVRRPAGDVLRGRWRTGRHRRRPRGGLVRRSQVDPHRLHPGTLRRRLRVGPREFRPGSEVLNVVVHVLARGQRHARVFHLATRRRQQPAQSQGTPRRKASDARPRPGQRSHARGPHRFHPPWSLGGPS
jgi:hypothetical protein